MCFSFRESGAGFSLALMSGKTSDLSATFSLSNDPFASITIT
jgi:hypothetical protein